MQLFDAAGAQSSFERLKEASQEFFAAEDGVDITKWPRDALVKLHQDDTRYAKFIVGALLLALQESLTKLEESSKCLAAYEGGSKDSAPDNGPEWLK